MILSADIAVIKIKVERMLRTIKNDGAKDHQVSQIMCMKFFFLLFDGKIEAEVVIVKCCID